MLQEVAVAGSCWCWLDIIMVIAGGMAAAGLGAALIGGLIAKTTTRYCYQMQVDM